MATVSIFLRPLAVKSVHANPKVNKSSEPDGIPALVLKQFRINSVIPQGSVLSPTLFLIYLKNFFSLLSILSIPLQMTAKYMSFIFF